MEEAVKSGGQWKFMEKDKYHTDDDIEEAIRYVKEELFLKNKDNFYTPEAIFNRLELPEAIHRPVQQRLQSTSSGKGLKRGIKKIFRSEGSPFYGMSDMCPIDRRCFKDWCRGDVAEYGSERRYGEKVSTCPREDGARVVFIEK